MDGHREDILVHKVVHDLAFESVVVPNTTGAVGSDCDHHRSLQGWGN